MAGSSKREDVATSPIAPSDLPLRLNRLETSVTTRPTARVMALTLAVAAVTCLPLVVHAQAADKTAVNAPEGCFDFVDSNAGTILPEQIPAEERPRDKTILVYCDTGSFAAQIAMARRMHGFENLRLLYAGFNEWKACGGMDAHAPASKKG
jgi:rhodanese-related sulfurtransferase